MNDIGYFFFLINVQCEIYLLIKMWDYVVIFFCFCIVDIDLKTLKVGQDM